jgi:hypothetical protein
MNKRLFVLLTGETPQRFRGMTYLKAKRVSLVLAAIAGLILVATYQNCAGKQGLGDLFKKDVPRHDDSSGNGQPYGGVVVRYYHVNTSTQSGSTSASQKATSLNAAANLSALTTNSCLIDARLEFSDNKYRLVNNMCEGGQEAALGTEIPASSVRSLVGLPLVSYNSGLWQKALPTDLTNPSFQWYIDLCSTVEGFYFDTSQMLPSVLTAELQIQQETQNLQTVIGETVKVKLTPASSEETPIHYLFSPVTRVDSILEQSPDSKVLKITRIGELAAQNARLRLETIEHYLQGSLQLSENHLWITPLDTAISSSSMPIFDGDLFCQ